MQPLNILLVLFSASITLAAPLDHRLEDIQCRCLSFSTDAKPTPCTYMESQRMDWQTANSLATDYDIEIQFASDKTISNILSIHRPLPSSVLRAVNEAEIMPIHEDDLMQRKNKIVCGFGEEVQHLGSRDKTLEPECHFIGYVVAALMAIVALYVLAEYIWSRCVFLQTTLPTLAHQVFPSRFFAQGTIKLDGGEKALKAEYKAPPCTQPQSAKKIPSTDIS
jgi:hypothetical protein